eukprot:CAMPEP_0197712148 /NCGR_PEP_ID=MMETSP1338-20131121/129810_1 /TAXON_ID=43686 ORGANISM="Pelagodinium beii, Strain RCC1491" /NCGR_SAMPLE_ID=MMETSP1338 /ASSEMBLY_ACC=CAM_ASM_000754 /LENGTH=231 /DNA_ID=CAMNT_0043296083 /DNA_START=959 /DNA_END=1654 /DNA_ORIENTATION=+
MQLKLKDVVRFCDQMKHNPTRPAVSCSLISQQPKPQQAVIAAASSSTRTPNHLEAELKASTALEFASRSSAKAASVALLAAIGPDTDNAIQQLREETLDGAPGDGIDALQLSDGFPSHLEEPDKIATGTGRMSREYGQRVEHIMTTAPKIQLMDINAGKSFVTRFVSTFSVSKLKRLSTRPSGVVSHQLIGARITCNAIRSNIDWPAQTVRRPMLIREIDTQKIAPARMAL